MRGKGGGWTLAAIHGLACLAACGPAAAAATPITDPAKPAVTLEEVLVTGERPGPGLWRVSRGEHELWILGTLEPLPKRMVWRSQAVDARIAASQEVLAPPRVSADVGFFRGLTLIPSLLRARHIAGGRSLGQILPHALYMRWLALRVRYLAPSAADERLRPMLAALDLYTHALESSGLSLQETVWSDVQQAARQRGVPVVPVTVTVKIENPKGAIGEFGRIPEESEVGCLETTITRLESDLPAMQRRANLWALGDVEGLQSLDHPDEQLACLNAVLSVPALRDQFLQVRERLVEAWLAAADRAITANASTVAVLPIDEMLRADGWLSKLRARGYSIDAPR